MRFIFYIIFLCTGFHFFSQNTSLIHPGDKAPPFVLNLEQNTIQGFTMPHMNKIVLMHFWNTTQEQSRKNNKYLNLLVERYMDSEYINAEGFEVISVAVQSDKKSWKEAITRDTLTRFTHGIAMKGFSEDVCSKFGVTTLPTDILIDETGKVILINPKIIDIENTLDSKKNVHPLKKDIQGLLAQASNKEELSKFVKIFLFNHYGDSLSFTRTNGKGEFMFHDIKLNQDFILKVDNQMDIVTSDPIALYSPQGELILEGKTGSGGFVFYIPLKLSSKLVVEDTSHYSTQTTLEISVTKNIEFKNNGVALTPKDEQELNAIIQILQKHKNSIVEYNVHTDNKTESKAAKEITDKEASTIKSYFQKKGIQLSRIRSFSKGNSELRHSCSPPASCSEEEHKQNRRVDFTILKN